MLRTDAADRDHYPPRAMRQNATHVLRETAIVYKVDVDAIGLKVKQDLAPYFGCVSRHCSGCTSWNGRPNPITLANCMQRPGIALFVVLSTSSGGEQAPR
jgi:hypothetical protein